MRTSLLAITAITLLLVSSGPAAAENAAKPAGDPVLEAPTLLCLGVYWIISGDDNKNARVDVDYRKDGGEWLKGPPLFRVEKGANKLEKGESRVRVPAGAWLLAGSVVGLTPDTEYELRLRLTDPDGGQAEKILKARTIAEPVAPADARVLHVVPGAGGGSGMAADPLKGLAAAQKLARPGDIILVHAGQYDGTFEIQKYGEPGKPIIWRGAGDGEAIIDGQGKSSERPERAVSASGAHDVWFEKLAIRNAKWGLVIHEGQRIVVRRCHFQNVFCGITGRRNDDGRTGSILVLDNVLEGTHKWSDAQHGADVDEHRGIELSGTGNVVAYNRVSGFKDGIDMAPSAVCVASDVHNNEVSECLDDGCEMDGSERNCRCFLNRFTNVFQGISVQPVFGGPIYVFQNALYNVQVEPFKMHNNPSGAIFYHNTCVKKGMPLQLSTSETAHNCVQRNNLFIGGPVNYAYENTAPMENCDFDYDGFGGGPWGMFLKWNDVRYKTIEEVRAKAPIYKHVVLVDPAGVFATGIRQPASEATLFETKNNDLRLKAGTAAIDAGEVLPGFNDRFAGKAPDLGAYEFGADLPHYGPRPEK
jgi:hypothetical protein